MGGTRQQPDGGLIQPLPGRPRSLPLLEFFPQAALVVERALNPPRTIASAESCTGGLLGAAMTATPGASQVYLGGAVTYSNAAKTALLGVPADLLETWGAVSEQVAAAMAQGVRSTFAADLGVAVTGVAGPGASERKPAGLVFVALATSQRTEVERLDRDLGRDDNRSLAVAVALQMLLRELDRVGQG